MAKAPGLDFEERDQSTVVVASGDTVGALVLWAKRGPFQQRFYATHTKLFRDTYGNEEPGMNGHYTALAALQECPVWCLRTAKAGEEPEYGGIVVMDVDATLPNEAFSSGIKELDDYTFGPDEAMIITGDNQGEWNDAIKVAIEHSAADVEVFTITVYAPDADGNYREVEEWECSRVQLKKDGYGKSMYIEDVINGNSSYIRVRDNTDIDEDVLPKEQATELQMAGGDDGTAPEASDIAAAWDNYFKDTKAVTFTVGMAGGWYEEVVANKLSQVAGARQDCECITDPQNTTTASAIIADRNGLSLTHPSYNTQYAPWPKVQDETNAKVVEAPPSGYICAAIARKNKSGEPHDAVYGIERGVLPVLGLTVDFDDPTIELLADAQINALVNEPGVGTIIWGGRTLQPYESARSWRSVRERLNVDETANKKYLRRFIGKNNEPFTRAQIKAGLDRYYQGLIGNGYYDVLVVCDTTNNTQQIIDERKLAVDIYVQPWASINRIQFTVTITRTGVSLTEVAAAA
jgi:hypothetical protein